MRLSTSARRLPRARRLASLGSGAQCRGAFLLEALIALGVFSFGMLGVLALVAGALQASGSAQWRSEGFDIAAATLARIWTEDPATLASRYDPATDGAGYRALLAQALRLPGVTALANTPGVAIDDDAKRRRVRVTVRWQSPADVAVHQASVTGMLPHR
jgi:type IV pilus assembly protein PilV